MGLKIPYGLVVLGSSLHMRDHHHGRHGAEENSVSFQISFLLFSNRRGCVMLFSSHRVVGKSMVSETETTASHVALSALATWTIL